MLRLTPSAWVQCSALRTLLIALVLGTAAALPAEVRVSSVESGSAGAEAGVREGDRIVARRLSGQDTVPVTTVFEFWWMIADTAPRGPVALKLQRGHRSRWVTLSRDDWGIAVRPVLDPPFDDSLKVLLDANSEGDLDPGPVDRTITELLAARKMGTTAWLIFTLEDVLARDERGKEILTNAAERLVDATRQSPDRRLSIAARYVQATGFDTIGQADRAAAEYRLLAEDLRMKGDAPVLRGRILLLMGSALEAVGRPTEALKAFEEGLAVIEKAAPRSLLRASALHRLGLLSLDVGELAAGGRFIDEEATLTSALAPGSEAQAAAFGNQARLAYQRGDLPRAEEFFNEQLRLHRTLCSPPDVLASTLQNLGVTAASQRRLDRAEQYIQQALALQEETDPDSTDTADILGNAGVLAQYRGDLGRSEQLLVRALGIFDAKGSKGLDLVPVLINLGKLLAEQGDYEEAERYYRRGLTITTQSAPKSDMHATLLGNLGWLFKRRGEVEKAIELQAQALAVLKSCGSPPLRIAETRENLGRLWIEAGRPAPAAPLLQASLETRRRIAPGSLDEAKSLNALGVLAAARGDTAVALERFRTAVAMAARSGPGTWTEADLLHDLAGLLARLDRMDDAMASGLDALHAVECQVDRLGATEAIRAQFRSRYLPWYWEVQEWLVSAGHPGEAYHLFERARARSFVALLAERDLVPAGQAEAALDTRRKKLGDRYDASLGEMVGASPERRGKLLERLRGLLREMDQLSEEARRSSPRLAHMRYPRPLTADGASSLLQPGTVALAYSVGKDSTLLYVLRSDTGVVAHVIPLSRQRLEEQVSLFRGLITKAPTGPLSTRIARSVGAGLFRDLIAPAGLCLDDARRLLIVPDGPLQTLPFDALVTNEGRYLIERRPVSSVLSLTVLGEIRGLNHGGDGMLVAFGDPRLPFEAGDDPRTVVRTGGLKLSPLPGARREVRRIARLQGRPARLFVGREATEEAFYREAPQAAVLHLATHILIDDRLPLNSAIVLGSSPERNGGNGLLQAWEIIEGLNLRATLVTLSGCETGLGSNLEGEGLIGLTRSFELAGARSILHTLWPVEDRAQAELMVRVYAGLENRLPLDEAVRRAQLSFLQRPVLLPARPVGLVGRILSFWRLLPRQEADLEHPFFWAALRIQGEWR